MNKTTSNWTSTAIICTVSSVIMGFVVATYESSVKAKRSNQYVVENAIDIEIVEDSEPYRHCSEAYRSVHGGATTLRHRHQKAK